MSDLAARVLSGDVRAAARLCRLVDDRVPGYREHLRALGRREPAPRIIGVTGSPGAGKSTLVDRLVGEFRARGGRVAVVAVDPTSPLSGGAILGDRIRMQRHFEDEGVFIRSVATRGALGGLSRSTRDVTRVLAAWGAGVVFIETVGVGQDELDVQLVAGTTIVVVAPGQGDHVQAIKAGILEIADVFVVNKADRPFADATVSDLESMLALPGVTRAPTGHGHSAARLDVEGGATDAGFVPRVVKTVATSGDGIAELVRAIDEHAAYAESPPGRIATGARTRRLVTRLFADALVETVGAELGPALDAASTRITDAGADLDDEVDALVASFRGAGARAP